MPGLIADQLKAALAKLLEQIVVMCECLYYQVLVDGLLLQEDLKPRQMPAFEIHVVQELDVYRFTVELKIKKTQAFTFKDVHIEVTQ